MLQMCDIYSLFGLMLDVIVSAIYSIVMNVYSGCLNFVMGIVEACV